MSTTRQHSTLIAHDKALEAAGTAIRLVMRVPTPLASIAEQTIRAAASVPANLAEGQGRIGKERQRRLKPAPTVRGLGPLEAGA
jgi:hypothetical protein